MGQTWTTDCFAAGHVGQTDLQNMETNFATIKSMFSGGSAPANVVAGMPWFDTTQKVMKQRNAGDTAWVGLMHGDTSQKVLVYRNAAMDGWAVDSSVTDKVIALKGGTTYTTGAATAGSWTISGLTAGAHAHEHNHLWYDYRGTVVDGYTYNSAGAAQNIGKVDMGANNAWALAVAAVNGEIDDAINADGYTNNDSTNSSPVGVTSAGTWRIAAAVVTMQYLDL